jgi:hypothetical protein
VRLYADHPDRRFRQILGDIAGLVVVLGAFPTGRAIYRWLSSYAEPGRELEEAAGELADNLLGAADTIGGIPLVGDQVAEPLANAGGSAAAIADAGRSLQDFVGATAGVAGVLMTVAALLVAVVFWLMPRVGWVRQAAAARAAQADPDGLDVLALRALANAPVGMLTIAGDGLIAGWREGDPRAVHALAQVEMARLGLYLPAGLDVR